jgi:DNA-binding transcriptional LysR family regulator
VSLISSTDMVVALPEALVQAYLDAGQLVAMPYDLGLRMDAYGIITRHGHVLSPSAQEMLRALRETVAEDRRQRKAAPAGK